MRFVSAERASSAIPHGTQEWAAHSINIQDGCEHDCRYCYAKSMAIRFKRMTADTWRESALRQKDVDRAYRKRSGRVMFPTSHDITPRNVHQCTTVLLKLLEARNDVLIVSKPHIECVKVLCGDLTRFRARIVFRLSIGSANDSVLEYWEPGAPGFDQRLSCLKYAFERGYETSVSCEPMLDDDIRTVVNAVRPYVTDSIWLGKVNNLAPIIRLNCPGDETAARKAATWVASQTDAFVTELYEDYGDDPLIKWKDSIKKVVGLARPVLAGLDV